jgi:hypothetical protein
VEKILAAIISRGYGLRMEPIFTKFSLEFISNLLVIPGADIRCHLKPIENYSQDQWDKAGLSVKRLSPSAFPQLPKSIVRSLKARGCQIPQSYFDATPHNVIRGMFTKAGLYDWAVLCSKNRKSSIVIFWGNSVALTSEITEMPDKGYLQVVDGDGQIGCSRVISAVDKAYIIEHYQRYGGRKPPPIDHQGINDMYAEKGSVVHYHYRRAWIQLQGID